MRSPVHALLWQLWARNRWGLTAICGYLVVAYALVRLLPANVYGGLNPALVFALPFGWMGIGYVFAVFTYLTEMKSDSLQVGMPRRMFVLPVRTSLLVFLPMISGTVAILAAWAALAYLILIPSGLHPPLIWPGLTVATVLVWLQTIAWSPFGVQLVRPCVSIVVLTTLTVVPVAANALGVPESLVAAALALSMVPAYGVAYWGVARARRGDGAEMPWLTSLARHVFRRVPQQSRAFASPGEAQIWFEHQQYVLFPALTGFFIFLFLVAALFIPFELHEAWPRLGALIAIPVLMTNMLAGSLGKPEVSANHPGMPAFLATKPVTSGFLVTAKFKVGARMVLVTWAMTLLSIPLWALATGHTSEMIVAVRQFLPTTDLLKLGAMLFLVVFGIVGFSWLQMIGGFWIGSTGRTWIMLCVTLGTPVVLIGLAPLGAWLLRHRDILQNALPALRWCLAFAVAIKFALTVWSWLAIERRSLLAREELLLLVAFWCVVAGDLIGLALWLAPSGSISFSFLIAGVAAIVPLPGIFFAPLALDWNRHR
jgi:hypothetical protein